MARYLVRRLGSGLMLLFALSLVTFVINSTIPLDPACVRPGVVCGSANAQDNTPPATLKRIDHQLGVDRPIYVQYANYVWRLVRHASFGRSWQGFPIDSAVRQSLAATGSLVLVGIVVLLLLALPLGILTALKARTAIDRAVLFISIFGIALHPFVIGFLMRHYLADGLHLFPGSGYCPLTTTGSAFSPGGPSSISGAVTPCGGVLDWASHLALPWLTFAFFFLPLYTRTVRARVLETLSEPHVAVARAKGASEFRVIRSHVLRIALLPLATMIGMDIGGALMATIYIETVYGIYGFGHLALGALNTDQVGLDLPMIAAIFFTVAAAIVIFNLIADLVHAALDPRIHTLSAA
jgi:peptide/nickel transport system permease protein